MPSPGSSVTPAVGGAMGLATVVIGCIFIVVLRLCGKREFIFLMSNKIVKVLIEY
jgi:hypothetical protein